MMIGPVINHAHVARSSTAVQAIASSLPAEVNIHPQDKDELVAELEEKRDRIEQSETPEESATSTRLVFDRQAQILQDDLTRRLQRAEREHWVALVFAGLCGLVFLAAIILLIIGTTTSQTVISLVSSAVPGFLSAVFFRREAEVEARIAEITDDLRDTEKVREQWATIERLIKIVPEGSRQSILHSFIESGSTSPV